MGQWHIVEHFEWRGKEVTVLFHDYLVAYADAGEGKLESLFSSKQNWESLDSFRIMRPSFLFEIYENSDSYHYFIVRPRLEGNQAKDFMEYLSLDHKTSPLRFMEPREARPMHRFNEAPLLNNQMYHFKKSKAPAFERKSDQKIFRIYNWEELKPRYWKVIEEFYRSESNK